MIWDGCTPLSVSQCLALYLSPPARSLLRSALFYFLAFFRTLLGQYLDTWRFPPQTSVHLFFPSLMIPCSAIVLGLFPVPGTFGLSATLWTISSKMTWLLTGVTPLCTQQICCLVLWLLDGVCLLARPYVVVGQLCCLFRSLRPPLFYPDQAWLLVLRSVFSSCSVAINSQQLQHLTPLVHFWNTSSSHTTMSLTDSFFSSWLSRTAVSVCMSPLIDHTTWVLPFSGSPSHPQPSSLHMHMHAVPFLSAAAPVAPPTKSLGTLWTAITRSNVVRYVSISSCSDSLVNFSSPSQWFWTAQPPTLASYPNSPRRAFICLRNHSHSSPISLLLVSFLFYLDFQTPVL